MEDLDYIVLSEDYEGAHRLYKELILGLEKQF